MIVRPNPYRNVSDSGTSTSTTTASTTTSRSWGEVGSSYRQRWEQQYRSSGSRWEDHEPAHRYAWENRNNSQYGTREWEDAESDLQSDWMSRHPGRPRSEASTSVREGWDTTGQVLRLHEERLSANTQNAQTGEVYIRKYVITENKTIEVPVTRKEVVVERCPVQAGEVAAADMRDGEEIRVPVMEEQVTVQKTPGVTEEIAIDKRQVQDTQQVTDTVRREEAHSENASNAQWQRENQNCIGPPFFNNQSINLTIEWPRGVKALRGILVWPDKAWSRAAG
jgi:uncharacterized protein (TIGR02271 family)